MNDKVFTYVNDANFDILIWIEPWAFEIVLSKYSKLSIWHKNNSDIDVLIDSSNQREIVTIWFNSVDDIDYEISTDSLP